MSNIRIPDDWHMPATQLDLDWWLELAPTLSWTWAKTYEDFAPHWYVVGGRTAGFSRDDSRRVGRIVRTYGEPGKFWRRTNLYLFTEDRARKFWCMFGEVPNPPGVINLAFTDRQYGPQVNCDAKRVAALRLKGEPR